MKSRFDIVALIWPAKGIAIFSLATLCLTVLNTAYAQSGQTIGNGPNRVAAVLPSQNGPFKWASAAVVAGLKAAHARDSGPVTIEIVDVDDELLETASGLTDVYTELATRRVALVIGPLTRNSVNALTAVGRLPITTITLNQPDPDHTVVGNMIVFGLAADGEAAQVARSSYDDAAIRSPNRRPLKAAVVNNTTLQGKRAASAFIQTWQSLGGEITKSIETDSKSLGQDKSISGTGADVLFVAVAPEALKGLRQAASPDTMIYGTSQLNSFVVGSNVPRSNDLNGIRLVDMPWQVQPDNLAVMAYPRAASAQASLEQQRLYALGIDTYRVMRELIAQKPKFELDGVTGRLRLDLSQSQRIERSGLVAEFRRGQAVPFEGR